MSEWRLVWRVTIKWANSKLGGGYPKRQVTVSTAADLRRVVEWARANPDVVGFPYERVRERVGEEPSNCRRGHGYGGGSATRVKVDWADCVCGGHYVYICRWPHCGDIVVDPPVYDDCEVTVGTLLDRARVRR